MKYTIGVCLLLAAACNAAFLDKHVNFQPFVELQHKAMRSLISAHASNDDPNLINNCFNQYITDQMNVLDNYNRIYTGCVTTAQREKTELTAQSAESRKDLLSRSDGMCTNLGSCDLLTDGLEFFDCYRNASADSYKVMFTLNSDANTRFNTISTKYGIIDSDLTQCVDEARLEYARELEKCDSDFNICISGTEGTSEPTTDKPVDSTPVGSTTDIPIDTSEGPVVSTDAPTVSTDEPPVSTDAPAVSTDAPAVSTDVPTVSTDAPPVSTDAPAVSTDAPAVSTDAPIVSTQEPTESTIPPVTTTERMPEEDIKLLPQTFRSALDKLKRFF